MMNQCWCLISILWLLTSSITRTVKSQRVDYCFADHHPCDFVLEEDEVELDEDRVIGFCVEMITKYAEGNENVDSVIFDLEWWPEALADIPANSEVCDRMRTYFPHCWWCFEQPCHFGVERSLTCNATEVELIKQQNGYTGNEGIFSENTKENEHATCFLVSEWWAEDTNDITDISEHAWIAEGMVGSPEECDNLMYVYPNCYWCLPNISQDNSYCTFEAICERAANIIVDEESMKNNNTTELEETCQELESFVELWFPRQIYTTDLCQKSPLAIATTCPQVCHACFNETHPPTCEEPSEEETALFDQALLQLGDEVDGPVGICTHMTNIMEENNATENHLQGLAEFRANSPYCPVYRQYYHQCFWCGTYGDDSYKCSAEPFCRLEENETEPFVGTEEEVQEFQTACQELQELREIYAIPATKTLCEKAERYSKYCSCGEPEVNIQYDYLGADTTQKKRTLVWMPRVAALLSLLGATYILHEVLSSRSNRGIVYYQLLACMATFDLCTAFAWMFSTAPIPNYNVEGAIGTDGTCTAQGFFIQLGFTSIFYNVALAAYYWLVIVKNYREVMLRAIRPFLYGPPLILGLGLALGGIPFYKGFDYACHIEPYTAGKERGELWQVLVFCVVPIATSILIITIVMIRLYLTVREQSRTSRRWMLSFGQSAKMERQVFYQALFYTMSFYITWPIVLCVYVTGWDFETENFGFSVLVAFVAPLQGFNNAMVFVRPKLKSPIDSDTLRRSAQYVSSFFLNRASSPDNSNGDLGMSSGSSDDENPTTTTTGDNKKKKSRSGAVRSMDPSVIIAMDEESRERMTESLGRESMPGASEQKESQINQQQKEEESEGSDRHDDRDERESNKQKEEGDMMAATLTQQQQDEESR